MLTILLIFILFFGGEQCMWRRIYKSNYADSRPSNSTPAYGWKFADKEFFFSMSSTTKETAKQILLTWWKYIDIIFHGYTTLRNDIRLFIWKLLLLLLVSIASQHKYLAFKVNKLFHGNINVSQGMIFSHEFLF